MSLVVIAAAAAYAPVVPALTSRLSALLHSGAGIAVTMAVMNLATFAYTTWAARVVGPDGYGAVAAMMNLLLVISVAALGLQATAARRIAAHPEDVAVIEARTKRLSWQVGLALGVVLLLAAPLIDRVLKFDSLLLACLAGLGAIPLTVVGGYAGILQGQRHWFQLGLVYLCNGLPRLLLGVALLWVAPSVETAITAVVVAAWAPVAIGVWGVRATARSRTPSAGSTAPRGAHSLRAIWWESIHNSQGLLAFFALSNVDVVIARNALPPTEAGLYAGGMIMAKMLMFLPQFVVVVAFPSMSDPGRQGRTLALSMGVVSATGLVATAGVAVLSPIALILVGGSAYSEIQGTLWAFALLGMLLALLQLLVYSVLARRGIGPLLLTWLALGLLVVWGIGADSAEELLLRVGTVIATLVVVLTALSVLLLRRQARSTDHQ